jgi:hypothetical protein
VTARLPGNVEPVRAGEPAWVAVARQQCDVHKLVGRDLGPSHVHGFAGDPPGRDVYRAVVAEDLLNGSGQERRIGSQQRE